MCLWAFVFSSCDVVTPSNLPGSATPAAPTPVRPRKANHDPCERDFNQPFHLKSYTFSTFHDVDWDRDVIFQEDIGKYLKLQLDTNEPDRRASDPIADHAQQAALDIDHEFAQLAQAGYGAWDGCYGKDNDRSMILALDYYEPDGCYWQPGTAHAIIVLNDNCITKTTLVHEFTHGIVDRTLGLYVPAWSTETGALYESFSDIFAILLADPQNSYVVRTLDGEIKRNLANPTANSKLDQRQEAHWADYSSKNTKYQNAGIFSMAAYFMMAGGDTIVKGGRSEAIPSEYVITRPLGKPKVARIFFHALSVSFIRYLPPHEPGEIRGDFTFTEAASGIINACQDLAAQAKGDVQSGDCTKVWQAFQAVGIPGLGQIAAPEIKPTVKPTVANTATLIPTPTERARQMVEKIYDTVFHNSSFVNNSHQTITIHNGDCTPAENKYHIVWQDFEIEPNQIHKFNFDWCPAVTFEITTPGGKSIPLRLVYEKNYYYRVTITDADLK
jgi:hypothetical protein